MEKTKSETIKAFNTQAALKEAPVPDEPTTEEIITKKAGETEEQVEKDAKAELDKKVKEQKEAGIAEKLKHQGEEAKNTVVDVTRPARRFIENVPTPGGIGLLLLISAAFLFAVVPVNSDGKTRMELLWLTLTGKTHLKYEEAIEGIGGTFANIPFIPNPTQGTSSPQPTIPFLPPDTTIQNIDTFFGLMFGDN